MKYKFNNQINLDLLYQVNPRFLKRNKNDSLALDVALGNIPSWETRCS